MPWLVLPGQQFLLKYPKCLPVGTSVWLPTTNMDSASNTGIERQSRDKYFIALIALNIHYAELHTIYINPLKESSLQSAMVKTERYFAVCLIVGGGRGWLR